MPPKFALTIDPNAEIEKPDFDGESDKVTQDQITEYIKEIVEDNTNYSDPKRVKKLTEFIDTVRDIGEDAGLRILKSKMEPINTHNQGRRVFMFGNIHKLPQLYSYNFSFDNTFIKIFQYKNPILDITCAFEVFMQKEIYETENICNVKIPKIIDYGKFILTNEQMEHINKFSLYKIEKGNHFFFIKMELLNMKQIINLHKYLKKINRHDTETFENVANKINKLSNCIHDSKGIYHNDYNNGDNILFDNTNHDLILVDFGRAKYSLIDEADIIYTSESLKQLKSKNETTKNKTNKANMVSSIKGVAEDIGIFNFVPSSVKRYTRSRKSPSTKGGNTKKRSYKSKKTQKRHKRHK